VISAFAKRLDRTSSSAYVSTAVNGVI